MKTQIQSWGNSLAVRIPRAFAAETQLVAGRPVNMAVRRGQLVISPLKTKYRLSDLTRAIKPGQLHHEQFSDGPIGREIW